MNHLRINADNLDQPLDINAGAKLDLGSTAKLRTPGELAGAHCRKSTSAAWARRIRRRARRRAPPARPPECQVLDYLGANPGASLADTLSAAMQRRYSAATGQTFYTGGGAHRFGNFESRDNNAVMTVAEALRRSVNRCSSA
ncbi:MAG: hypothetical protein IPF57_03850 [Gammaproteobacteria bacterium]|nr:hypothetical protein [Gammaproteobacteria bacterium]